MTNAKLKVRKFSLRLLARGFALAVAVSFVALWLGRVFAGAEGPTPAIELSSQNTSFADGEPGAWKVNKLAGWTGQGKARIVFDVESLMKTDKDSDVILVLDNGSSMYGDRLTALKEALRGFINKFFIELSDGVDNPGAALAKMSENRTNSTIKSAVDAWYAHTLIDYADMIEDTQYCNDRSIQSLGGWNPNGGKTDEYLYFGANGRNVDAGTPSLDCQTNDAFTVDVENGNGALVYPVGLASEDELTLAGHGWTTGSNGYLYTDGSAWSLSPRYFYGNSAYGFSWYSISRGDVANAARAVRPVVSISPGTLIARGNGSENSPWVLE